MTTLHLYLYRPKQLRDYLATKPEPLKIVFRLKCWLLGFHNFGVDEVPRHRCWTEFWLSTVLFQTTAKILPAMPSTTNAASPLTACFRSAV
jgi:hypothetical protein